MGIKEVLKGSKFGKYITGNDMYIYVRNRDEIEKNLVCFGYNNLNKSKRWEMIKDMIHERKNHLVPFVEYFYYNFPHKNFEERRSFVTDIERVNIANKMNNIENDPIFYDKGKTYKYFKKFYKRDFLKLEVKFPGGQFEKFEEFCKNKEKFICKPVDGGCGKGIKIICIGDYTSIIELYNQLIKEYKGSLVIEELINQDIRLQKLNPNSVNTVRVPTIRYDNRVEVIHPFLRVGQGEAITDNAGSGGIICAVDVGTGKVYATSDEFGKKYDKHPTTKQQLIGFEIPRWKEAVELAKILAEVVPDNRYCSWDLALTEYGWCMVEGNARGQFIWQIATQTGFRDEVMNILKELNLFEEK